MNIRGLYKTSLIDFPGKIGPVFFTGGCNLQCKYCHNPDLARNLEGLDSYSNEEALDFLMKRSHLFDGVTLSGGEPTLSRNIDSFFEKIKSESLSIKLDSNGLDPATLERLVKKDLLDYVAIDIKTSPEKYRTLTGVNVDFSDIVNSIDVLRYSGIDYEVRTTCIPGFVTLNDLKSIEKSIGHVEKYFLQQYRSDVKLMDESFEKIKPYPIHILKEFKTFVETFSDHCEIRGI